MTMPMSPILSLLPCAPVERAHVAQARRIWTHAGRDGASDDVICASLWLARVLPTVVDVAARVAGSGTPSLGLPTARSCGPLPARTRLCALVSWLPEEDDVVEARVLPADDAARAQFDAPLCLLRFPYRSDDDDSTIRVQRFVVGRS